MISFVCFPMPLLCSAQFRHCTLISIAGYDRIISVWFGDRKAKQIASVDRSWELSHYLHLMASMDQPGGERPNPLGQLCCQCCVSVQVCFDLSHGYTKSSVVHISDDAFLYEYVLVCFVLLSGPLCTCLLARARTILTEVLLVISGYNHTVRKISVLCLARTRHWQNISRRNPPVHTSVHGYFRETHNPGFYWPACLISSPTPAVVLTRSTPLY
jgi:hypothetical protein